VDARTAADAEVRLYDNLFSDPDPDSADKNYLDCLSPNSLEILKNCKVEAMLAKAEFPASFQFMRLGYFCVDSRDSKPGAPVFNRSVSLKDSFKP
jgi:glutaminyl-tRNA synthetase